MTFHFIPIYICIYSFVYIQIFICVLFCMQWIILLIWLCCCLEYRSLNCFHMMLSHYCVLFSWLIQRWVQWMWRATQDMMVPIGVRWRCSQPMPSSRPVCPSLYPNWTMYADNWDLFWRHLSSFFRPVVVRPGCDEFRLALVALPYATDWRILHSENIALHRSIAIDRRGFDRAVIELNKIN